MIKKITPNNFRSYGRIIRYPDKHLKGNKKNLFRIVLIECFYLDRPVRHLAWCRESLVGDRNQIDRECKGEMCLLAAGI